MHQTLMEGREGVTEKCHLKLKNIKISNKNRSFLSPGMGGKQSQTLKQIQPSPCSQFPMSPSWGDFDPAVQLSHACISFICHRGLIA